jgi:hypothetical protein
MKTRTTPVRFISAAFLLMSVSPFASAAIETRDTLKTFFETGDVPTQDQFRDLIDSFLNYNDDGLSITGVVQNSSTGAAGRQSAGDVIDSSSVFAPIGGPGAVIPPMAPEFSGQSGFLGLRLSDASAQTHFGYFQLTMDDLLLIDPAGIHVDYFVFNDAVGEAISVNTVPVPAAAWLLGSALGMLGVMRRKAN